jgi:arabinan endo-1,5-alpha-L-arabinosidase
MSDELGRLTSVVGRGLAIAVAAAAITLVWVWPANAAVPVPVYGHAADPGVAVTGEGFVAFTTGSLAPVASGDQAVGPWSSDGSALSGLGSWSSGGSVWAPDAWQTSAGWVLYYSAPAKGMNGQRCIGVATAANATGPYTPRDTPLVCPSPALGADDTVPGSPVSGAGVIDPSPFRAADGTRYLLYRTSLTPSTLRMVQLDSGGLHAISASRELRRSSGIIENPAMVQRGSDFVLFASAGLYSNCGYATVWYRSTTRWNFAGRTQHTLMDTSSTGICGPGGMDMAPGLAGGSRAFLHGWRCEYPQGTRNCASTADVNAYPHFRSMYVGVLRWGSDGATPRVAEFLAP